MTTYTPIEELNTPELLEAEREALVRRHTELSLASIRLEGVEMLREALEDYPRTASKVTAKRMDTFAYAAFSLFHSTAPLAHMAAGAGMLHLLKLIVTAALDKPQHFTAEALAADNSMENDTEAWKARFAPDVLLDIGYLCLIDALNGVTDLRREAHNNMHAVFELRGIAPSEEEMRERMAQFQAEGEDFEEPDVPPELQALFRMLREAGDIEDAIRGLSSMPGVKVSAHQFRIDEDGNLIL